MQKLFDWISGLSSSGKILLVGGLFVVLIVILYLGLFGFPIQEGDKNTEQKRNELLTYPDAENTIRDMSKMDELSKGFESKGRRYDSANDYWNDLGGEGNATGGLLAGGSSDEANTYNGEYLDPSIYSELEIEYIRSGTKTKAEIDARHRKEKERLKRMEQNAKKYEPMTQEQQDSLYFARMEKTYGMLQKMNSEPDPVQPEVPVEDAEAEPELKRIDVERKSIPSVTLSNDGIISSLGGPNSDGSSSQEFVPSPAKATFLRSETVTSGQRVTMRLLEDLLLSDGTLIPANTHIKGTCEVGSRLNIKVSAISYGGKIYYVGLNSYDNDGTQGIYCPVIANEGMKKKGQKVVGDAIRGVGSAVSTIVTRSPFTGQMLGSSLNNMTSMLNKDGTVTVNLVSGYEFFLYEDNSED